jgi:hypothetical protein
MVPPIAVAEKYQSYHLSSISNGPLHGGDFTGSTACSWPGAACRTLGAKSLVLSFQVQRPTDGSDPQMPVASVRSVRKLQRPLDHLEALLLAQRVE